VHLGGRADAVYRLVLGEHCRKIGGFILTILTFASNRTRRDDTWVDEDEYEDEEEDDAPVQRRESRRARILRGALARRQRVAEKFANPLGRKTDAALFSGKRMDEDEQVERRGTAVDPDDVLFSGSRATPGDFDEYDPLLNGHSVTEPVAAAAPRRPLRRRMPRLSTP
jgi:S-DNA-T family DNA segregation ATPase FtsK/SpoIIIE